MVCSGAQTTRKWVNAESVGAGLAYFKIHSAH